MINAVFTILKVLLTVFGAISASDIVFFIIHAFGNGSGAFTGGISRPLFEMHSTTPFANGAKEDVEAYMRIYGYDYKKACCNANDFDYQALG